MDFGIAKYEVKHLKYLKDYRIFLSYFCLVGLSLVVLDNPSICTTTAQMEMDLKSFLTDKTIFGKKKKYLIVILRAINLSNIGLCKCVLNR